MSISKMIVTSLAISLTCLVIRATVAAPDRAIEKAFVSFRISPGQWMPAERFEALLRFFEAHKGVTDELTLFHSITHAPLPLDKIRARMRIASERMREIRKRGYRTGINVLTTIGHHEEDLKGSLHGEYTYMTDIHGRVSRGSMCPNDERMRATIRELYEIVASAGPDYIWIDDDVRLAGHMPIYLTCFCDNCLDIFSSASGTRYTRPSLSKAFVSGSHAERLSLRKAWLAHNRQTIARLFTLIEKTVHGLKPGLPLGFMTGDRFFEGYDFDTWAAILSGPERADVFWRPGGGFYGDEWTPGLAQKSHQVGRQSAILPPSVLSIQSEIENFPYQRLKKASHITVLEAASHIAAGCTGAAFNVLSGNDEPLDEYQPIVASILRARPFLDRLAKHLGRHPRQGVYPIWCKDSAAGSDLAGGNWSAFSGFLNTLTPRILELGLPACYGPQGAQVTLLSGDITAPLSDDEVREILSRGVYMDAYCLDYLNKRGFGALTGFAVERSLHVDCIEKQTTHPLNGRFANRVRDCRQSFNKWPAAILKKTHPKAEALSGLIDYSGQTVAPCTSGVFENARGGRICVAGYFPWTFVHNLSKSSALKSVLRWLSRDRLAGYVASYHKINLWITETGRDTRVAALLNASFDTAEGPQLLLRTQHQKIRVTDMQCRETLVRSAGTDGPYQIFTLPDIPPWQMVLVTTTP